MNRKLALFALAVLPGCAASPPPHTDTLRGPGPYSWVCQGDDSHARNVSVPISGKTVQVRGTVEFADVHLPSPGNSRRGSQAGVYVAYEPQAVIALSDPSKPDAALMLRAPPKSGTPWLASFFKTAPRDNTTFARIAPSQSALPFEVVLTAKGVIGASIAGHVAPWVLPAGHPDHLGLSCSGPVSVSFSNVVVSP